MRRRLKTACTHTLVSMLDTLAIDRPHELLLSPYPPIGVLLGCRGCIRAHLYALAQHLVVGPLAFRFLRQPIPSEYAVPMQDPA